MSRARKPQSRDPRKAGGRFAGPGGPQERHGIVIDATDSVLLDDVHVALVELHSGGEPHENPAVALKLAGRINKTRERAEIVYLFDEDGAAGIITELLALASRGGFGDRLMGQVQERLDTLAKEGNL